MLSFDKCSYYLSAICAPRRRAVPQFTALMCIYNKDSIVFYSRLSAAQLMTIRTKSKPQTEHRRAMLQSDLLKLLHIIGQALTSAHTSQISGEAFNTQQDLFEFRYIL